MRLHFKKIDVFTSVPFKGNPVAVVLDEVNLPEAKMQQIAKWMNISETTFIQPSTVADYKLRIFTQKSEVGFAGHPTIGSSFALYEEGRVSSCRDEIFQECKAGLIRITIEGDLIFAQMPYVKSLQKEVNRQEFFNAIGSELVDDPTVIDAGPKWAVARVQELSLLQSIKINVGKTYKLSEKYGVMGFTIYCIVPKKGVYVRTFAPFVGVNEDPVCGSGNAAVAEHIRISGEKEILGSHYTGFQGEVLGREGKVYLRYEQDNILIGGNAVTVIDGLITI